MKKRLLALIMTISMVLSFAAVPAHAATFSSDNWVQYERGFYTNTSNFTQTNEVYTEDSDGDNNLTSVRMVANTSSKITSTKNPVAYKFGATASDYGEHESDNATYAHMRVYLATFDDENHDIFKTFYLRMDKDGTGSSRDAFEISTWKPSGSDTYGTAAYAQAYTNSNAYTTKDWFILKQSRLGNGPDATTAAADCDAQTRVLADSDYDKLDIIAEYNKNTNGATYYLFANEKFVASWFDNAITKDVTKHFHGIVFRTLANKTPRANSSYIAVKMDADRMGHREYYNTDDYYVTMEDVLNDAGLGDAIDSTMMYKSKAGDLEWYMPGNEQAAYTYEKGYSERQRINENVTYSGTEATIAVTNTDSENYAVAAKMLSGFYPVNGKCGIAYESYHPRAKYIKLSFDQTISNDGIWVEYATRFSETKQALQMWNNGGYLVVGIKGSGKNETCNGSGSKPIATMTGKNHIDWILEPIDGEAVKQYVYVNGVYVGEGSYGGEFAVRLNDIAISTMKAEGTIKIDDWSMTVYNDTADIADIDYKITGKATRWIDSGVTLGEDDKLSIHGKARTASSENTEGVKLLVALYKGNTLLDIDTIDYTSDKELESKQFNKSYDGVEPEYAKLFLFRLNDLTSLTQFKKVPITAE